MRYTSFASAAAVALMPATALAADLPARRAPLVYAPPSPAFTWTGFNVGFQLGYEFGRSGSVSVSAPPGGVLDAISARKNGLIGGGHIGYLFSSRSLPVLGGLPGSSDAFGVGTAVVFGIEADIDASSARANNYLPVTGVSDSVKEGVQGSVRGRLGVAFDRVLLYGTGGYAVGGLDSTNISLAGAGTDQFSQVKSGYTIGGGVEYAFTNTISGRVEYRYTDFGSFTNNLGNSTGGLVNVTHRETNNRVQAGVSVKFDPIPASAPVVARY